MIDFDKREESRLHDIDSFLADADKGSATVLA
jgi:hypothetical protein